VKADWEPRRVLIYLGLGLASYAGPVLVILLIGLFVHGEAMWLLPTMVFGAPTSAIGGVVAAVKVYRAPPSRRYALKVWLLTAGGTFVASVLATLAGFGVVWTWVAGPLLAGCVLGAAPAAVLALIRAHAARSTGP